MKYFSIVHWFVESIIQRNSFVQALDTLWPERQISYAIGCDRNTVASLSKWKWNQFAVQMFTWSNYSRQNGFVEHITAMDIRHNCHMLECSMHIKIAAIKWWTIMVISKIVRQKSMAAHRLPSRVDMPQFSHFLLYTIIIVYKISKLHVFLTKVFFFYFW